MSVANYKRTVQAQPLVPNSASNAAVLAPHVRSVARTQVFAPSSSASSSTDPATSTTAASEAAASASTTSSGVADLPVNHVRITPHGSMKGFISYALRQLEETEATEIVLHAIGAAVNRGISVAEIVKRKYPGLHQNTQIFYTKTVEVWEPTVPGLDKLKASRNQPTIQIVLSKAPLDPSAPGYQAPL
ncbi:hypothetical protein CAOG_03734 [Capsaspora owczarzaki ATCC 30864]|uniref:DNA/RNA-binding protein Alba-like domain-containing protein n=1 Tax=Capsaspora owczarzaki (strain ATCC 30864) TaxID=595528 RepID=A0A0D2VQC4_CAPO3|nr:hypothetical protein CAOG_03734 [Capsaspora owczarzaki ATCC 30864]KJE92837.1 hypothetical protein CAOG_003734 [Capsaspora owczarzaki ATCC 30864]|eukprot:XP_004363462.1 hypothetical protein CAOG_03734 [Capsaspora owczarzaki ATCC 30864]